MILQGLVLFLGHTRKYASWFKKALNAYLIPMCLTYMWLVQAEATASIAPSYLGALTTTAPLGTQEKQNLITVRGLYYNYDYGYSVLIPKGRVGFRAPAPFPNHGFGIKLSTQPESSVWVDASYDAAEWKSYDDAVKDHIDYIKYEGGKNISILQKTPTRLHNLRAVRFVIGYEDPKSGTPMKRETLLAIRESKGEVGIVYTIELTTPADRYSKDKAVVDELGRALRLRPLPK